MRARIVNWISLSVIASAALAITNALSAQAQAPQKMSEQALPIKTAPAELVALGKKLFFDSRLSADGSVSCASCHQPDKAFTDGLPLARGIQGRVGTRNTPSLLNLASDKEFFWDGRQPSLEAQALEPFFNPLEHGLQDAEQLLQLVRNDTSYMQSLQRSLQVNAATLTTTHIAQALAAFQRSLQAQQSAFDRYVQQSVQATDAANTLSSLTASALRGLTVFKGQAQCASCHRLSEQDRGLTDNDFHAIGLRINGQTLTQAINRVNATPPTQLGSLITTDKTVASLGRFVVTQRADDIGKFKTPSLRNVALTAPYMHDGSIATLEEAVEHELYYRGQKQGSPIVLTPQERDDLIEFLRALTDAEKYTAQVR